MKRPAPIQVKDHHMSAIRGPREDHQWYWRARDPARKTVWTGWATRPEAIQTLRQLLREPEPLPELRTIADLLNAWLAVRDKDPTIRSSTKTFNAYAIRHPLRLLGALALADLNQAQQEHYRNTRLGEGTAPRTIANELEVLRVAWRWALDSEQLKAAPLPTVKIKVRGYVLNHRTPTEAEVTAALAHMRGEVQLAVKLLSITGARISEVTSLRRCDVDLQCGLLHLNGKTGPRSFPLTPLLRELLQDRAAPTPERLLGLRRGSPQKQVWLALHQACEEAGVQPFTAHGIRRMAVNRLLRANVEPKIAAVMTGHSVQVMLEVYRKATDEDKEKGVRQAGLGRALSKRNGGGQ